MLITLQWLKEKGACDAAKERFATEYPEGGDYQEILNKLAEENNADWAQWLMQAAGPVDTVLEVDELTTEASLFFAGRIIIKGALKVAKGLFSGEGIKAGRGIEAGWGIEAGEGIEAGRGIEAGWGIKAGRGIEAGEDYGIYAGLELSISLKAKYAKVIAKERPKNLLLGEFKERRVS